MPTIYALKPAFQRALAPVVSGLARAGISANQVTVATCAASVALGLALTFLTPHAILLLPPFFLLRMALNAVDGLLARQLHQQSPLGALLNELTDVISDVALYLPFCHLAPYPFGAVIFLAALTEFTGVTAQTLGASRRFDGPFGKSDRALAFSLLALWLGFGGPMPNATPIAAAMAALAILTVYNRARKALDEIRRPTAPVTIDNP